MTIVKSRIIRIGNSQGLRIPKVVLEQLNMHDEVELEIQDEQLVIRRSQNPRDGWATQFKKMATEKDDQLLDEETFNFSTWDDEDWEWV